MMRLMHCNGGAAAHGSQRHHMGSQQHCLIWQHVPGQVRRLGIAGQSSSVAAERPPDHEAESASHVSKAEDSENALV